MKSNKISVLFDAHTKLQLDELCKAQNIGYSLIIRTIVSNFFATNEEVINRIIDKKNNSN